MRHKKPFLEEPRFILIPVIDVLLAVFLFLAVLAFQNSFVSLPILLPKGSGAVVSGKLLNIFLDREGNLYLKGKEVSLNDVLNLIKREKIQTVNVFADKRTPYGRVVELLNELRSNGIYGVNLVLKKKVKS